MQHPHRQLSVKNKVLIGFAVALAILIADAIMSSFSAQRLAQDILAVSHTQEVLGELRDLENVARTMQSSVRGFIIAGDDAFLEPYKATVAESQKEVEDVRSLVKDNSQQLERLAVIEGELAEMQRRSELIIEKRRSEGFAAVEGSFIANKGKHTNKVHELVVQMTAEEERLLEQRVRQATDSVWSTFLLLVAGSVIAVSVVGAASLLLLHHIRQRETLEKSVVEISKREQSWKVKHQRTEAVVLQSEERLRALLNRLEQTREEERTRISRDIHDELGQNLTAIKMDLRWIERRLSNLATPSPEIGALAAKAAGAIEVADATSAVVQELAMQLRPGVLDRLGLGPALLSETRRFQARTGIACKTNVSASLPEIGAEAATALFRILQECLTNVTRHAGATRVMIRLGASGDDIHLCVFDNGLGISATALNRPESLGLWGMKERAATLGGEVVFRPGKRRGTMVKATIPNHGT